MAAASLTGAIPQGIPEPTGSCVHSHTLSSVLEANEPDSLNEALFFLPPCWLQVVLQHWGGQKVWLLWPCFTWSYWLLKMKWQRAVGHPGHFLINVPLAPRSCPAGLMTRGPYLDPAPLCQDPPTHTRCASQSLHTNDIEAFCSKLSSEWASSHP